MGIEPAGFKNATFILNEPNAVFYSGQVISGKLNFDLNQPLSFIAINIQYLGESHVLWNEEQTLTYNGVRRIENIKYEGREQYFNVSQCLSGGNGLSMLPAGPHSIPFFYQLPFTAPSSFKGEKGTINYKIIATVLLDGLSKEEVVKDIDVIAPADLNLASNDVKKPIVMEFEEESSCNCFCASKSLSLAVKLPTGGYCPGQTMPIIVAVKNDTTVEITKIIFEISTKERYHSQRPMSSYIPPEEVLVSMKQGPILARTNKEYMWELKIPDFIAPNLENCSIIDVGFFFKVKIKLSGCIDDMYDESELWMGLIPPGRSDVSSHPLADRLPRSPLPVVGPAPSLTPPPPYRPPQYVSNVQIYPPGPVPAIPYPTVANVVDKSLIYGSKNSIAGVFEVGFRAPETHASMPVPGYPYPDGSVSNYPLQPSANPYSVPGTNPPYPVPGTNPPYPVPGTNCPPPVPGTDGRYSPRPTAPPPS